MRENRKLKGARVEKRLTQEDMSRMLGISRLAYVYKENGRYSFTEQEIKKVCEVLEKEPQDIFFN